MKKSILILTLLVVLLGATVRAQNPTISISQQSACPGSDVAVSINATNLLQIGAITLFIAYDTAAVQYITLNNVHPELGGLLYNHLLAPQPMVAVSWASIAGANIAAGKLFDIQYHYKNGQGNFAFLPNCEISTTELVILDVAYGSGSIQSSIQILSQPADQLVYSGESAGFAVESVPITAYQWQRSTNEGATFVNLGETANYSGIDTPTLEIATANLTMTGNLYRCRLTASGCTIYSRAALLEVRQLATQTFQFAAGWNTFAMAVQPLSLDVDDVFDDLGDQLIFVSDGQGVYYPAGGVNTLPQIDPSAGYFLKISNNASIVITGIPTVPTSIPIGAGWNLLPVLLPCDVEIGALPAEVLSKIEAICEIAGGEVFWPSKNIETLTTLQTTKMYRLKANEDFLWEFPACNP
ncbi:MAG: hypothetical protein EOM83_01180 [Clostridia bacterium]|nr:hypothetical protein [Clostridia bacterium]